MRKRKKTGRCLGALFLTAVLVCSAVLPVFAVENPEETMSPTEKLAETFTSPEVEKSAEAEKATETTASPEAEKPAETSASPETEKTTETTTPTEPTEPEEPNGSSTPTAPRVTTDTVTLENGMLKIPVDLGGYKAEDLLLILNVESEGSSRVGGLSLLEIGRRLSLENGYAIYSPYWGPPYDNKFEEFWTKAGNYNATLEFRLSGTSSEHISISDFTVSVLSSSEMWQVDEKLAKFDGSEDITFSFKNGTNLCELKSIDRIEIFMWKGIYENPSLKSGFTFDMSAGTLTIDKDYAKDAIIEAVQEAQNKGLNKFPTRAYINAFAKSASGQEMNYFNDISKEGRIVPAWELDLTDFNWEAKDLKIVVEATDYVYTKGEHDGATIKCTGALEDFESVFVDDHKVDRANYTLESGSTILTFTTKYLNTLSVGKHTVTMNYTYGSVDTELTIKARSSSGGTLMPSTPKPSTPSTPSASENPAKPADNPASSAEGTATSSETSNQTVSSAAGVAGNSNTSGSKTSVQTGDSATLVLWGLTAVFALGICGVMGWKRYSGR